MEKDSIFYLYFELYVVFFYNYIMMSMTLDIRNRATSTATLPRPEDSFIICILTVYIHVTQIYSVMIYCYLKKKHKKTIIIQGAVPHSK